MTQANCMRELTLGDMQLIQESIRHDKALTVNDVFDLNRHNVTYGGVFICQFM